MLTLEATTQWLRRWAAEVAANEHHLTALDAVVGDADHGSNLLRGTTAMVAQLDAQPPSTVREALTRAGLTLVSTVGGASGPLFGTLLLRAGVQCSDAPALDADALLDALRAGVWGVRERGRAELGDKTMLDALQPAIDALDAAHAADASLPAAASAAARAARAARDATANLVARRGRASYLGERSRGGIDPGAASAALLFDALAEALGGEGVRDDAAAAVAATRVAEPGRSLDLISGTAVSRGARVGFVLVSHSLPLAHAAAALARELVGADAPRIAIAAGRADGGTGTNATRVAAAISEASEGAGVVVLTDLGSAVLSADMALEFLGGRIDARIVAAPFVEGLLAAVVRAHAGDEIGVVAGEASGALAPKQALLHADHHGASAPQRSADEDPGPGFGTGFGTVPGHAHLRVVVCNEGGLHARPAADIAALAARFTAAISLTVAGKPVAAAISPLSMSILAARAGTEVHISAVGDDAADAVRALAALIEGGFGEPITRVSPPSGTGPLGVSSGRVTGPVAVFVHAVAEPSATAVLPQHAREAAEAVLGTVLGATAADYRRRASDTDGHRAQVLAATAAIADDAVLRAAATAMIRERGATPERAVWEAIARSVDQYRAAGGDLLDRITDLKDIRDRVIAALTGVERPGLPERSEPYILIADDLAPADTVTLDPTRCLALVTEQGGPTSHTAIIARELGLPAVVGVAGATRIAEGTILLVDGDTGEVVVRPTAGVQATATGVITLPPFVGPCHTADGQRIVLAANVGAVGEVARAVERGAEGVGLFRTEFCFLDRVDEPTVDEQIDAYREVFTAFAGQHVVVRTLDAGSDKPLPFLTPIDEPNPALGLRGVRTAIRDPEVLDRQLRAVAEAAQGTGADVSVMAPMIATLTEAREFSARARAAGIPRVGLMLETPAAALTAVELCAEVDFLSVGTNDLSQYTMAADRMAPALASLVDPWQPALLRMVHLVGQAAADTDTPLGVCGEASADPDFAAVLVGLGATSLSMVSRAIPAVAARLGEVTVEQCRAAAVAACAAAGPDSARAAARAALS